MPNLYLIRGLPNSGKTTFANTLKTAGIVQQVVSADDYFEGIAKREGKTYTEVFDPRLLREAHTECLRLTLAALRNGDNVAVANTFTQRWEMAGYLEFANHAGATLTILTCERSPFATEYNDHNVPDEAIFRMKDRWEPIW